MRFLNLFIKVIFLVSSLFTIHCVESSSKGSIIKTVPPAENPPDGKVAQALGKVHLHLDRVGFHPEHGCGKGLGDHGGAAE